MNAYDACPLPDRSKKPQEALLRMLRAQRIAVVGLSDDPSRASNNVAHYLLSVGKEVIAVNPSHETAMGLKCYRTLEEIPGRVDLVDVFRRAEFCADVVRSAVKIGAKGVWLQSGIVCREASE